MAYHEAWADAAGTRASDYASTENAKATLARDWVREAVSHIGGKHPQALVKSFDLGFSIAAMGSTGFPIALEKSGNAFQVWFGNCQWEFSDLTAALSSIDFALSDRAVLRIIYKGAVIAEWELGTRPEQGEEFNSLLAGGNCVFNFWRPSRRVEYRNTLH